MTSVSPLLSCLMNKRTMARQLSFVVVVLGLDLCPATAIGQALLGSRPITTSEVAPAPLPEVSWWPEWRHDGYRSGHSNLKGEITKPVELWRYSPGALDGHGR